MNGRRRLGAALSVTVAVAILGTGAWFWQDSLVPATYSVMAMGRADHGGGPVVGHHDHGHAGGHGDPSAAPLGRVSQRFGLVAGTLGVCLEWSC